MNIEELLHRLGAGARVRSVLGVLPSAFAEAFAMEALRLVEAGEVAVRPDERAAAASLAVARSLPSAARRVLLMETLYSRGGVASLALARWRVLDALMRQNEGRLLAAVRGFLIVLAAWEAANGRALFPGGADWPALESEPFREGAPC